MLWPDVGDRRHVFCRILVVLDDNMIPIRGRFMVMLPSLQARRAETMVDGLPRACRWCEALSSPKFCQPPEGSISGGVSQFGFESWIFAFSTY